MIKIIVIILFASFIAFNATGQYEGSRQIDSLGSVLATAQEDTAKVTLLLEVSLQLNSSDTSGNISIIEHAFMLAEKLKWQRGIVLALNRLWIIYKRYNNHRAFLNCCFQCASAAKNSQDKIGLSNIYNLTGQIYDNISEYDSALDYYKKSIQLDSSITFQIRLLGNSGVVYNKIGDYPHALECYERALMLQQELLSAAGRNMNDSATWAALLLTTGDIYVSMSQYDKALANYMDALKIAETIKQKDVEMLALANMGNACKLKKDFTQAIQYYEQSLKVNNSLSNHNYKAAILNEMADVYLETGNIAKAMAHAKQSLDMVEGNNYTLQLSKTYTTLGRIYTQMNNYQDAVTCLLKAIGICEKNGTIDEEKNAWEALSITYENMHQAGKAFDAYRHFISLRDSVYNIDKAKELVRIDLQSGFDRKQLADSVKQVEAKKVYDLRLQKQRAYTYGGFAGLLLVLLLSFFIYRNYSQQKKTNKIISKANVTIQNEKQVSENLLLNILPEGVAHELKTTGKVSAKLYNDVTVLFTDFVNFTRASEQLSPQLLVAELDACFQTFDEIIGKYNIEKIKTVGDAYMAVSGLPHANPDHACDMVKAAIEIRDFMVARKQKLGDVTFGIRIGINSGSVVAGIVGLKKFAYDIWGDTVNTASRMEQKSEPGKINISETTYLLISSRFNCEYRGKIEAKNKGSIDMYFVV